MFSSQAPRPEVVLVLSRKRSVSPQDSCPDDKDLPMMITASNTIINSRIGSSGHVISSRPPRILESPSDFGNYDSGNTHHLFCVDMFSN